MKSRRLHLKVKVGYTMFVCVPQSKTESLTVLIRVLMKNEEAMFCIDFESLAK